MENSNSLGPAELPKATESCESCAQPTDHLEGPSARKVGWFPPRISLRWFVLLLAMTAVAISLVGRHWSETRRESVALQALLPYTGRCIFGESRLHSTLQHALEPLVGPRHFMSAEELWLHHLPGDARKVEDLIEQIASVRQLHTLRIGYSDSLAPSHLAALRTLPKLDRLYIYGCKLEDRHAEAVSRLTRLKKVVLVDTSITDGGMGCFEAMPCLERLDLTASLTTRDSRRAFRARHPDCILVPR